MTTARLNISANTPTEWTLAGGQPRWGWWWGVVFQVEGEFKTNNLLTNLLITYLFTPWVRILLEKLAGFQLVKKFAALYGTRKFITAFTSAGHLSLSLCERFVTRYVFTVRSN